jgi:hypothetical protein
MATSFAAVSDADRRSTVRSTDVVDEDVTT